MDRFVWADDNNLVNVDSIESIRVDGVGIRQLVIISMKSGKEIRIWDTTDGKKYFKNENDAQNWIINFYG